jgi:6-phosphogluconolactonase
LFCVNEVARRGDRPGGSISSFSVDPDNGKLTLRDEESSAGNAPCHLSVDPEGLAVLVANYGSGHLAVVPIGADGRLQRSVVQVRDEGSSVDRTRQEGPHAHCVRFHPFAKWAVMADLGTDHVIVLDARHLGLEKAVVPRETLSLAPGTGPRHVAFARDGKTLYVLGELASTITVFDFDTESGKSSQVQSVSTLPKGTKVTNHTAEIVAHPSGKYVYASNRGHDSIAAFAIDHENGKLTPIGHTPTGGKTPRNFNISPNGKFLVAANQETNNLVVFRVDEGSGKLTPTGKTVNVPAPVCVLFEKPARP